MAGDGDGGVGIGGSEAERSDLQEEQEGRVPGETRKVGMAKMAAQKGDVIYIISYIKVPCVQRPVADNTSANYYNVSLEKVGNSKATTQRYELVGDCHLSGLM